MEVVVIGGGLVGCATAVHLARRGHAVAVVDRATFPREKVCGEGLMPHGVAALARLGLDAPTLGQPFEGIRYHAGPHVAEGRFPAGPGYGLRRHAVDAAVRDLAARTPGVTLLEGTVRAVEGVAGARCVQTRTGALPCRAVVGADGLHSRVRRALGLERPARGRRRYGLRAHFALDRPAPTTVDVHVVEGGELYVTPTGPREVNLAVLAEHDAMADLRGDLDAGLLRVARQSDAVAAWLDGARALTRAAATGPLRRESTDVVADGAVLVGDAAGFLDGITGEGMSLGLIEAEIAADVLAHGLRTGRLRAADLAPYRRRRRQATWKQVAMTEVILGGIRHRPLARATVGLLARDPRRFGQLLSLATAHEGSP